MKRAIAIDAAVLVFGALAYQFLLRGSTVAPRLGAAEPVATIGEGSEAVGVTADGAILIWAPVGEDAVLPRLPLDELPPTGRLRGPALQQAQVLGAAPALLRPCIEGSYYGESGVDVNLRSGIELRFGDASQAAKKWRAAAAVLADPSVTALDYVNVHSPRHPAKGGSGHLLPSASEASGGGCAA